MTITFGPTELLNRHEKSLAESFNVSQVEALGHPQSDYPMWGRMILQLVSL